MTSEAETLFRDGRYDEAVALVDAMVAPGLADRAIRAQSHYAAQRWEASLEDFSIVLRENGPSVSFGLFQKARTAIGKTEKSKAEAQDFWRSCSDSLSLRMEAVISGIIGETGADPKAEFRAILHEILNDKNLETLWLSAFDTLVAGCRGEQVGETAPKPPRRKILVAGMGWSGSSAIFDYLREFREIHAVASESSMIEGAGGFRNFINASASRKACIDTAVNFFFRSVLGYAPMRTASCLKEMRGARANTLHAKFAAKYAEGVQYVALEISRLIDAAGGAEDIVEQRLKGLGNTIADNLIAYMVPEDKAALLDNCIHSQNIDLARYFRNTHVICCNRDPRSNYVALKREFAGFSQNIDAFIADQRGKRSRVENRLSKLQGHLDCAKDGNASLVGFEEFVMSSCKREAIARELGLDIAHQDRFTHFKPWESMRNAQIHQEYESQDEIRRIQKGLPEFCVEPIIVPLGDPRIPVR